MSMTEPERHEFYELAKREVSDRFAELMIKAVPPDPERLATKDDLAVLGSDLRTEMAELRGELRNEMAVLRGDLRTEMAELRGDLRNEIHDAFQAQTRVLLVGLIVSVVLIAFTNTLTVLVG